jgi:hypothetical protein
MATHAIPEICELECWSSELTVDPVIAQIMPGEHGEHGAGRWIIGPFDPAKLRAGDSNGGLGDIIQLSRGPRSNNPTTGTDCSCVLGPIAGYLRMLFG